MTEQTQGTATQEQQEQGFTFPTRIGYANATIVENDRIKVDVRVGTDDRSRYPRRSFGKKTRAYVSGQREPGMEIPPYGARGENAENDAAWKKYNKEEIRIMRAALDEGLALAGIESAVRFSRKAGCSCGCSSGFILQDLQDYEIFITVKEEAKYADVTDEDLAYYLADFAAKATTNAYGSSAYYAKKMLAVAAERDRRVVAARRAAQFE